jgi:hypothetical protein
MSSSSPDLEYAVVVEASTRGEAEVIAAVLAGAGIRSRIVDREGCDAVLVGHRLTTVQVCVPAQALAAAREALAAARAVTNEELEQQAEAVPFPEPPASTLHSSQSALGPLFRFILRPTALALSAALFFLVLWSNSLPTPTCRTRSPCSSSVRDRTARSTRS